MVKMRKLINFIHFPVLILGISIVAFAQDNRDYDSRIVQSPIMIQKCETAFQKDLCRGAMIRSNIEEKPGPGVNKILYAVVDEDPGTFLRMEPGGNEWLEIEFQGAWYWVNQIEIQYRGNNNFKLATFSTKGSAQDLIPLSIEDRELENANFSKFIEIEPIKAKGLRFSMPADGKGAKGVDIYEIKAWFYFPDPDKVKRGIDDPENWLLCENIDGMGADDMKPFWTKISGLGGWCPNSSHWCHWWNGSAAWAGDFKGAVVGGAEDNHTGAWTGMDYHDMAAIALHGYPCGIVFPNGPPPLSPVLVPSDILSAWGERDNEWFVALSCSPYAWPNCPWSWAAGFNGQHLQCGFTTTAYATGGAFLGGFAELMIRRNMWDPALPITMSWFLARALWQPAGTCVLVLADDWAGYSDYLWTQGWVSPDPSPPLGIVWAMWDPPFNAKESETQTYPPPLTQQEEYSIAKIGSPTESVNFSAKGSNGIPVRTSRHLIKKSFPDSMMVYQLQAINIDSGVIAELASDICAREGVLCNPDIGQDEEGNWWASDSSSILWGNPAIGFLQFANSDKYLAKLNSPPSLPPAITALVEAIDRLQEMGLSRVDACSASVSFNIQSAYDLDLFQLLPDSSFDLSINTEFNRCVDGYNVYGPGGHISMTFGENLEMQHFTCGGWQNLINPVKERIITVTEAINLLNSMGEDATIGGIPPEFDTLLIDDDSTEAAYYNSNGDWDTDILEPIYKFKCYAVSSFDTVPCVIFVPARASLLRGIINEPKDNSSFKKEITVTFDATAMGGVAPYAYKWYSDVDGYLGSGASLAINHLSVKKKDTVVLAHTITLEVIDNVGMIDSMRISLTILPCCDLAGDASNNGNVNVIDVTYLINYLYKGGAKPICSAEGDANGNGIINVQDITSLINYLYKHGAAPICRPE
jgi:hypothetical protein